MTMFMLHEVVDTIDLSRFPLPVELSVDEDGRLMVTMRVIDRDGDQPVRIARRARMPDGGRSMTADEWCDAIARWIYVEVRESVLHELQECFIVNGVRVQDPHADRAARVIVDEPWPGMMRVRAAP